ncbi:Gfo/Idh/MocA family oxidoreductase [Streptomyces niveus]|uniref:Gfo/Idh/MocA family protein n=1 Tax=Streptomyces niveus TaxID=193462 RepID=UPI0036C61477
MTATPSDAPSGPGPGSGFAAPRGGPVVGDTVLGTGVRTARRAVDEGLIGVPVAACAFITAPGPERPYPASELYDRPGGGPLFDTGPLHISALVHLLGPVSRVTATAPPPRAGERFEAEADTQVTGLLEHAGGALTTLVLNSGVHEGRLPRIEVHGTEGSLSLPDPDSSDGPVELHRAGGAWEPLPVSHASGGCRSTGRAPGELARHVLDVMLTLLDAARDGVWLPVRGDRARPEAVRP